MLSKIQTGHISVTRVMAIDPGVTSGYAIGDIENGRLVYKISQFTDDVDDLWRRLHNVRPRYLIAESFEFRNVPQRGRSGINLFPVQLIGVARLYSEVANHQCAALLQTPATGKGYYTDILLKQKKLYKRGVPHGTDASRHLLHCCTFGILHQYFAKVGADFADRID